MTMPVTLTAGAIAEIKRLMAAEGFDTTQRLRIGVKGGGCSGFTYVLGFDDTHLPHDHILRINGMEVVIDETGAVQSARMKVSVNPYYDGKALDAARSWRYRPATLKGEPVKYRKSIQVAVTR